MLHICQGWVCVTVNIKVVLAGPACEELHSVTLCHEKDSLSVDHKLPSPSNCLTEEKLFQYQFWNWLYPDQTPLHLHFSVMSVGLFIHV